MNPKPTAPLPGGGDSSARWSGDVTREPNVHRSTAEPSAWELQQSTWVDPQRLAVDRVDGWRPRL